MRVKVVLFRAWVVLFLSVLLSQTALATGRSIVVFAPHPDDEALMSSGIISKALANGDTVTVIVVTNGDYYGGVSLGYTRETESVAAMSVLGLSENNLVFLGYGDQTLMSLYTAASPNTVIRSNAGATATYANRGLGGLDYHTYVTGQAGSYTQATFVSDIQAVLANFHPDDVYTTSEYDDHPDHSALGMFVQMAVANLARSGAHVPFVHLTIVHAPCEVCDSSYHWPNPPFTPTVPFFAPPTLSNTPLGWDRIEALPVPSTMALPRSHGQSEAPDHR